MPPQLLSADVLLPFSAHLPPVLHDAALIIDNGRITAIGQLSDLRRQLNDLPDDRRHLPGILLPGFVNAHTHLELGYQHNLISSPVSFTEWVSHLLQNAPPPDKLNEVITRATQEGIRASLAAGVTTVGDISRIPAITRRLLGQSPIRAVSFGEIVSLGKMRDRLAPMLTAACDTAAATDRLSIGLSPHAPYTVEGTSLRAIVRRAIVKSFPMAMHLAELSDESDFLHNLSGPLGRSWDLMQKLDVLDANIPLFPGGPIRWAQLHSLLIADRKNPPPRDFPVLLAHCNYLDDAELDQLAASVVSVAYCPRTRNYFGHDSIVPHRYRDMLDAGINVCLATDSLASNPDLSVLHEARFLLQRDNISPLLALEMITARPADALGLSVGRLIPGNWADLIALPLAPESSESPDALFAHIINTAPAPSHLWIAGNSQTTPTGGGAI